MSVKNMVRHMRTTQERRRWSADADDVHIRLRRSPGSLPSAWDDFWRWTQCSWKEHRRYRWRRIAVK